MAVSPYPQYWVDKVGKSDGPMYRGFRRATEDADVDITPVAYKRKQAAMAAILELHPRLCACGCGEPTKGGEFRMGHDAKHKSALIREVLAGGNDDALAEIERRGWLSHLDKAREVNNRPKPEPRAVTTKDNEDDQEKARRANDRLLVMKAACVVLKGVGQYRKDSGVQIRIDHVDEAVSVLEGGHPDLIHEVTPAHWEAITEKQLAACERERARFEDGSPFATWLDARLAEDNKESMAS